jgi:hypothetical protein
MRQAGSGKLWKDQAGRGIIMLGLGSRRRAGNKAEVCRKLEVQKDPKKEKS